LLLQFILISNKYFKDVEVNCGTLSFVANIEVTSLKEKSDEDVFLKYFIAK
jgi:hypothetical protein